MKKLFVLATVLLTSLLAPTLAFATNDPVVPGDDCSGNPVAIGQPANIDTLTGVDDIAAAETLLESAEKVNAVDLAEATGNDNPVEGPASKNNPGESTGAVAQSQLSGSGICGL